MSKVLRLACGVFLQFGLPSALVISNLANLVLTSASPSARTYVRYVHNKKRGGQSLTSFEINDLRESVGGV